MSFFDSYSYVDAHYEHHETGKRMPWRRLLARDVEKLIVLPARVTNCFASVQRYKDAVSLLEMARAQKEKAKGPGNDPGIVAQLKRNSESDDLPDQQLHYHGPYFDFDAQPATKEETKEQALGRAQEDVKKLARFFLEVFSMNPAHVQVWFSGKKGFHLMLRPEVFEILPHRHLTYITKRCARTNCSSPPSTWACTRCPGCGASPTPFT